MQADPAGAGGAVSEWAEYKNAQGRSYWYHAGKKRSVWEKPDELKSARERAMETTAWREYKSGGRSYYVHKDTKQSSWTVPADLKYEPPAKVAAPGHGMRPLPGTPPTGSSSPSVGGAPPFVPAGSSPDAGAHGSASPHTSAGSWPTRVMQAPMPVFASYEDAETAFTRLLHSKGVGPSWTWEQTLREIVTDPMYKALKTIAERKLVYQKYVDKLRTTAAKERAAHEAALRPRIAKVLDMRGGLKAYASFATFKSKLVEDHVWRELQDDEEAHSLFEQIRGTVRARDEAKQTAAHERSRTALQALLNTVEIDAATRWRDVHRTVLESAEYAADDALRTMSEADMLAVFDEHMRNVERDAQAALDKERAQRRRTDRVRRDAYKALLQEHMDVGTMNARSTWAAFLPRIRDEDRFRALLGAAGSSAQQLFYDALDVLERDFSAHMKSVQAHQQAKQAPAVAAADDWARWHALITSEDAPDAVRGLPEHTLRALFDELLYQSQRESREARRRTERRLRYVADDLRYAFKKANPPLDINAPFDAIVAHISDWPEFLELKRQDGMDAARGAWERFVRRQAERHTEANGEQATSAAAGRKPTDYRDLDESPDERKRKVDGHVHDARATRRRMQYGDVDP
ncbi:U1 snRNP protein [Malassezia sp. CBS 17886]|nr:U1 snRNP protein [Malassezia sp. CBS 17886]